MQHEINKLILHIKKSLSVWIAAFSLCRILGFSSEESPDTGDVPFPLILTVANIFQGVLIPCNDLTFFIAVWVPPHAFIIGPMAHIAANNMKRIMRGVLYLGGYLSVTGHYSS